MPLPCLKLPASSSKLTEKPLISLRLLLLGLVAVFLALPSHAAPALVTPKLSAATRNQAYVANLLVGSAAQITGASVTGLPAGLVGTHNGSGSIAIIGTPTQAGTFNLTVNATDAAAGTLNAMVSLTVVHPVVLPSTAGNNVTAVSVGQQFACAVVSGGVQCWGKNDTGQLGNNSTADSPFPVQTLPSSSGATAVSAGRLHACAVVNGGVQCWGNNYDDQLGNPNINYASLVPVQTIPAGSGATSVTSGAQHSCAVVNGGIKCWGDNFEGQLGSGNTFGTGAPIQIIAAGSGATAVSAGSGAIFGTRFTCAVVNSGVQCWGAGAYGQLGNGNAFESRIPVQAIPAGSGATSIDAGFNHVCAVVNGGVMCWGNNDYGQLGNNSQFASATPVLAIAPGSGATAVSTSGFFALVVATGHSCAVVNGGIQCWGKGSGTNSLMAAPILAPGSGVIAMSTGDSSACAIVNTDVKCWGDNSAGQLGTNVSTVSRETTPVQSLAAGSGATAVSAPGARTFVVIDGGLVHWGGDATGSLALTQVIAAGSGIDAVTSRARHSCVLRNGGVQCWGANNDGRLGNNTFTDSAAPVQAIPAGGGVASASAGIFHTCAVVNGGVQCWGGNTFGQLGDNSNVNSAVPVQTLASGSNATVVSAGGYHTCAVVNGGVQCWGDNFFGQLGINSTAQRSPLPVHAIPAGSGATSVSAGSLHTCAIVNGGVQCWGDNGSGQLGNAGFSQSLVPVQTIPPASGVTLLSAGAFHTCATVNGGAQCWGYNLTGQLGNNSVTASSIPINAIPAGSGVLAISAGNDTSCALVNGGVACWGANNLGELRVPGALPPPGLVTAKIITPPALLPGIPTIGAATAGNALAAIAFNSPATSGGVPVYAYTVTCGGMSATGSGSPIIVTGLVNGTTYSCSVTAVNIFGSSAPSATVSVTPSAVAPLALLSVVSRKTHGAEGDFPLEIDQVPTINGLVTVEPRSGNAGHLIIFKFNQPIQPLGAGDLSVTNAQAQPVGGDATAVAIGSDVHVSLSSIADNTRVAIALANINGTNLSPSVALAFLVGDINRSYAVNAADIAAIKARSGQVINLGSFRFDVNASGSIDDTDVQVAKARSGVRLP